MTSLVLLLVSRFAGFIVAVKSFLETIPPLRKLEHVHVSYPTRPSSESLPCDESVVGHRIPVQRSLAMLPIKSSENSLRVVQLTDIHLGSVTTPDTIHGFCKEIVESISPDLVLITGDMLTTPYLSESEEALEYALEPLKQMKGRVFACFGNHDLETETSIRNAFVHCGICLLVDESVTIRIQECEHPIQIIGFNYHHANSAIYQTVLAHNPLPTPDSLCFVLVCQSVHYFEKEMEYFHVFCLC